MCYKTLLCINFYEKNNQCTNIGQNLSDLEYLTLSHDMLNLQPYGPQSLLLKYESSATLIIFQATALTFVLCY